MRFIAKLWAFSIAWVFSALIHSTDSEVGGLSGLQTMPNMISVTFIAVLFLVPMFAINAAFVHRRWRGFMGALLLWALVLGGFLAMAGSTARTVQELAKSVARVAGLFVVVMGVGTLPHIILVARQKNEEKHG